MAQQSRVVLVLQENPASLQLANLLETGYQVDVEQYRLLSRGAFIEEKISLVVLELRENNFSNLTSMISLLDTLEHVPPIVLLCDDKSVRRAKEFEELGIIAVYPSSFPPSW